MTKNSKLTYSNTYDMILMPFFLFMSNAVSFCNTCTSYENKPMSSHTISYVVDHEMPSCARFVIEVQGSFFKIYHNSSSTSFASSSTSFVPHFSLHVNPPFKLVMNTILRIKLVC